MACFHPLQACQTKDRKIRIGQQLPGADLLYLPCGNCLGCHLATAKSWAIRCTLELQQHESAVFTTLTYDETHNPGTLQRRDLQLWLKRLRSSNGPIRFFASGEYGETTKRPHYHAIIYGMAVQQQQQIQTSWGQGHTHTVPITAARIAYVAGYTSKKAGQRRSNETVDPETGEVYQPPFIQMSRRPGIGGHARQWPASWRSFAIHNNHRAPVPRFLHDSWKQQATEEDITELKNEKAQWAQERNTFQHLEAAEQIAKAQQAIKAQTRRL